MSAKRCRSDCRWPRRGKVPRLRYPGRAPQRRVQERGNNIARTQGGRQVLQNHMSPRRNQRSSQSNNLKPKELRMSQFRCKIVKRQVAGPLFMLTDMVKATIVLQNPEEARKTLYPPRKRQATKRQVLESHKNPELQNSKLKKRPQMTTMILRVGHRTIQKDPATEKVRMMMPRRLRILPLLTLTMSTSWPIMAILISGISIIFLISRLSKKHWICSRRL